MSDMKQSDLHQILERFHYLETIRLNACIARDYLPHMYGDANYVVIDDIRKLPYQILDIYRGLTSSDIRHTILDT